MPDFKFSKRSLNNRKGVDPRLIEISDLAIKLSPIDFGIPQYGGVRNEEDQRYLYAKELSKCDGVKNKSEHQMGKALDFYAYVDGVASWKTSDLAIVAASFLQAASILGYKLNWGGLWEWKDLPHVQLMDE